ncbi:tetratricopeptide repeat-containing sulfotransferase family protein [Candidatus Pelagibacter bacterium nBUS_25]|uniref:tetratricopeptide repeat-containing sulfotransferase family protein n=1 Tax=Candidatus Pelagibacter bacterium nBUS_25 TaxID=3374187 RepID=UPI003EB81400
MINREDILYITKETKRIQNFFESGNFEKVIKKTKILLKKDPSQTIFYNLIGLSYKQLNNLELAEKTFKSGLKVKPNDPSILVNLGATYRLQEKYNEAKSALEHALELNKENFNALVNYANVLKDLNQNTQAIDYYNKALAINNKNQALLTNLAGSYQMIGDFIKSKEILRNLHKEYPQNVLADQMYSSIHKYDDDQTHQKEMLEKLNKENISSNDKMVLCFSIAKSFSDQKNSELSSKYFIMANDLKFDTIKNFDFDEQTKYLTSPKHIFKDFIFEKNTSSKKPELIFIVGLPRSGTTLTHQIISSHSEIFGAGESPILKNVFVKKFENDDFIKKIVDLDKNQNEFKENLRVDLLSRFKQYNNNLIILDKAPLNLVWLGFINILFPTAKIIHCKRNLKDTALSIYKNTFEGWALPWSYNQEYLVKFIDLYKELMAFWHMKMPGYIYDCHYEKLVNDPIEETKKLINFCNLTWDENCLDHTKNKTGIKTVSIEQARNPIHKKSVNLNENYLKYLDFLNKISE